MAMKGICLYVATDDLTCHNIVDKMLQRCAYRVLHVGKATDGLKAIWEAKDDINLVLTNIHRLQGKGPEILDDIQNMFDFPIIFMSPDNSFIQSKGKEIKAAAYILKLSTISEVNVIWESAMAAEEAEKQEIFNQEKTNNNRMESTAAAQDASSNEDQGKCTVVNKQAREKQKRKDIGAEDKSCEKEGEETSGDDSSPMEKKPRMVWSKDMHQKFLEAIEILGPDKAFPKKIVEAMNMTGLTRENVASHLQKYRICLRRAQEESSRSSYGMHLTSQLTGQCLFPNQSSLLGFNASERYSSTVVNGMMSFQQNPRAAFDSSTSAHISATPRLSPCLPNLTPAQILAQETLQSLSYPNLSSNHTISVNNEVQELPQSNAPMAGSSCSSDYGFIGLRLTDNGKSVKFGQQSSITVNNDIRENTMFSSSLETPEIECLDSLYHSTSINYITEPSDTTLLQRNSIICPSLPVVDSTLTEDHHMPPHSCTMGYDYSNNDEPQAIVGDIPTNFNQFSFCNTQVSSSVQPLGTSMYGCTPQSSSIHVPPEEEVYIPLMETPGNDILFQDPTTINQQSPILPNDLNFIKLLNEAGISSHQLLWDEHFNDTIFDH